jgi:hypothetical protein
MALEIIRPGLIDKKKNKVNKNGAENLLLLIICDFESLLSFKKTKLF